MRKCKCHSAYVALLVMSWLPTSSEKKKQISIRLPDGDLYRVVCVRLGWLFLLLSSFFALLL